MKKKVKINNSTHNSVLSYLSIRIGEVFCCCCCCSLVWKLRLSSKSATKDDLLKTLRGDLYSPRGCLKGQRFYFFILSLSSLPLPPNLLRSIFQSFLHLNNPLPPSHRHLHSELPDYVFGKSLSQSQSFSYVVLEFSTNLQLPAARLSSSMSRASKECS